MSLLHIEVIEAFEALSLSIEKLCEAIHQDNHLLAWAQDTQSVLFPISAQSNAREKAIAIIRQLYFLDEQAPREILVCAGFIGASNETLELAAKVNMSKDRFKSSILALKPTKLSAKEILSKRIHLKQCYRKIPILPYVPHKISWTWAHTRSIKKINIKKAEQLLIRKGQDIGIQIQLQKLSQLSQHENLAIIQELAPHLRANIVFKQNNITQRMMLKGPVPIFFPCDPMTPKPKFSPPSEKCIKDNERQLRSDIKIDPIAFLPAIHAHRYLRTTTEATVT